MNYFDDLPNEKIFDDLPNEKIFDIFEQMDNQSLSIFAQSNTWIHNLCQDVLDKRFENLSVEEKENILVSRLEKITYKLYNGENLTTKEMDFAVPYLIKGNIVKDYFRWKLEDLEEIDDSKRQRYEIIFKTANKNWCNEKWNVADLFPLITTQEMQHMIHKLINDNLESFSFYVFDLLLQATLMIKGWEEAEKLREKLTE